MKGHGPGAFTGWDPAQRKSFEENKVPPAGAYIDPTANGGLSQRFIDHRQKLAKDQEPLSFEELEKAQNVGVRKVLELLQAEGIGRLALKDLIPALEIIEKAKASVRATGDTKAQEKAQISREEALAQLQGKGAPSGK